MTALPSLLFLTWQDPESRRILPVGRLLRLETGYEFAYINAVAEAGELGFEPLPSFPSLDRVYRTRQLPSVLANRMMKPSRADYAVHVTQLGLDPATGPMEPFMVLARSGGRRATDTFEVFALPVPRGDYSEGRFLARGVRHVPGAEEVLKRCIVGATLCVVEERQNPVARYALALQTVAAEPIGYVPDYLAAELDRVRAPAKLLSVFIERINPPPAPVQQRLLCRFEYPSGVGSAGFELFRGERYQPRSSDATQVAA